MQRTRLALVVGTGDEHLALFELDLDGAGDGERELALRALDGDVLAVDRDVDAGGDVDGKSSDT